MDTRPIRVLFVCTGNICRSPMAEAVFAHLVQQAKLSDRIQSDSAGTIGYHKGERADIGTLRVLEQNHIPYNGRARQLQAADLADFDYLVAMDDTHLTAIKVLGQSSGRVVRLLDYLPDQPLREVPDPYASGAFDLVYALVQPSCVSLLAAIRRENGL